ncbi:MAG: M20 family metallo-hydrolase [Candidatus Methanomethylophilaceae archaeon]
MQLEVVLKKIGESRADMTTDMVEMIKIPAIGPMNGGKGETLRADLVQKFLKGFDSVERIDVQDNKDPSVKRPNIIAKKNGKEKGTVWIISHMDTVLPGDLEDWISPPYEPRVEDDKIYGLGTEDNGQAIISSIYAAKYIPAGVLTGKSIGLAIVSDEETTSVMGIEYLVNNGYFSDDDLVIVPDWGMPDGETIEVAEKHLLWLKVEIEGKQTHGSTPHRGINAYRVSTKFLADLLDRLAARYGEDDPLFRPPVSTFEPTKSTATVGNVNTIPGYDEFWMDCRILPRYDPKEIIEFVNNVAREHSKKTGAKITVKVEQCTFAGQPSSVDNPDFQAFRESVSSIIGKDVDTIGVGGGTCANFFRLKGLNAYVWQCGGGTLHQPNEHVFLDNIVTDAKVFATLFFKLCV